MFSRLSLSHTRIRKHKAVHEKVKYVSFYTWTNKSNPHAPDDLKCSSTGFSNATLCLLYQRSGDFKCIIIIYWVKNVTAGDWISIKLVLKELCALYWVEVSTEQLGWATMCWLIQIFTFPTLSSIVDVTGWREILRQCDNLMTSL